MKLDKDEIKKVLNRYQKMDIYEEDILTSFDQSSKFDEDCPIHWASREGNLDDLKLMLKTDIDVNVRGDIGNTSLHDAVRNNNKEIIKLLIESGADPYIKNDYGDLPIDLVTKASTKRFLLELIS